MRHHTVRRGGSFCSVLAVGTAGSLLAAFFAVSAAFAAQTQPAATMTGSSILDCARHAVTIKALAALLLLQSVLAALLWRNLGRRRQAEAQLRESEERFRRLAEETDRGVEQRVAELVEKSREKDRLLLQQSRFAAMGEMIGNIAHQWRQPLNMLAMVIQQIQMEQEKGMMTDRLMEERVAKGMDLLLYLSRTIDDFRNFFRPEMEAAPFKVAAAVVKTVSFFEASCAERGIKVSVEGKSELTHTGHASEFSQALLNILNNARDALLQSGAEQPFIKVEMRDEERRSVVAVSDNGGGIDPGILDKIFDPYFTTKEEGKGTGVGLYMARTIVERNMQGRLFARNTGGGAEFTIVI